LSLARRRAEDRWPVELHAERGWRLVVKGDDADRYAPQPNAHGDPANSLPVYLQEIVNAKAGRNGLAAHRPNLVMANTLGTDSQLALGHAERAAVAGVNLKELDGLLVARCGIDSSMRGSAHILLTPSSIHPVQAMLPRNPP
jgi:hypothetical protein